MKLGILQNQVKKCVIPVIFTRVALSPQSLREVSGYFYCEFEFSILNLQEFSSWTLTSFVSNFADGHNKNARTIKVFLNDPSGCQEILFSQRQQMGVRCRISKEKRISKEDARKLLESGTCKFFDNDKFMMGNLLG